jgi:hypothetical protein
VGRELGGWGYTGSSAGGTRLIGHSPLHREMSTRFGGLKTRVEKITKTKLECC